MPREIEPYLSHSPRHSLVSINNSRPPSKLPRTLERKTNNHSLFLQPLMRIHTEDSIAPNTLDAELLLENHQIARLPTSTLLPERNNPPIPEPLIRAQQSLRQMQQHFALPIRRRDRVRLLLRRSSRRRLQQT